MKLLQKIEGVVSKIAHDGSGEILREGKPIHVYNTIPGEKVTATIVKRTRDAMRGRLEEVIEASPDRVIPRCPFAGTCGGCKWQHVDYPRQLALKLDLLREDFSRANLSCPLGRSPTGEAIDSVEPCPDIFYYRNRMDFVFGRDGQLGLKRPDRWWDTLDLSTCFLLSEESVKIVNAIRDWARSSGLPFWNSKTHTGFFRYLVIREGKNTGERLVMLVTSGSLRLPKGELEGVIGDLATSIVHGINPRLTDLSIADEIIPLKGDPWIHEEVNGIRFKITPNAFFQTNTVMAARLQNVVRDLSLRAQQSNLSLLDLYCGSGFFSLSLAKQFDKIIGIELDANAIACAKENATTNAITNVDYFVSPAESYDWSSHRPDVVILDPPRAGMHPSVIETILKEQPETLIYVSCNYPRFLAEFAGQDGRVGLSSAYRITDAKALDLFPHTPHMECVFRLERT